MPHHKLVERPERATVSSDLVSFISLLVDLEVLASAYKVNIWHSTNSQYRAQPAC
jgi:hypothetical protein